MYHRYLPMRQVPLASEDEIQAMQSKLEARSKAVRSPKEKSALEWEKPVKDSTGVRTKCGRYSCAKVTVSGVTSYELFKLCGTAFRQLNKGLDNFLQVQKLAQIDADKGTP